MTPSEHHYVGQQLSGLLLKKTLPFQAVVSNKRITMKQVWPSEIVPGFADVENVRLLQNNLDFLLFNSLSHLLLL